MFAFKIHRSGRQTVLAACDFDLLDKEFRAGDLRIAVASRFYGSERVSREQIVAQLRACTIANLVGKNVVGIAIELGLVEPQRMLWIGEVPHAQVARVG